jgi:N-acetyl-anhydromuramyl-L-alanine amidase AmpD
VSYKQRLGWFRRVNGLPVKRVALPAHGGSFADGRPHGVVFHYTVGCNDDISPALKARGISVHFSVGLHGAIYQYVSVRNEAWHADNANGHYIGIEHAAYPGNCDLTDKQLETSAKLVAALREYYERKRGFSWPLNKIQGRTLIAGFHDHRDGDGVLWNYNGHTDHLYHWSWDKYLDKIRAAS